MQTSPVLMGILNSWEFFTWNWLWWRHQLLWWRDR